MRKKRNVNITCLVPFLFAVYMVLLVWIILFKLQLSIPELNKNRSVNLIPFYYENEVGMNFHLKEVIENIMIFIPFGIYLCMFKHRLSFKMKLFVILTASFALEIFQYILAIGGTDITDIITNTCGGIMGLGLYELAIRIFHGEEQVNRILTVFAAIVTVLTVGGLSVLLISN